MSGTHVMPQRYMRAFAHVPLLHLDSPKSVLVICFGVGNTAHAASLHPSVQTVAVADLSRDVLDHASFFEESNGAILKNEKVKVFVNDGRHHLLTQAPGSYDLVTLEPPPITHAGVTSLYSREFYEIARSRLSEGGFVTQWLPAYQASERSVLELVRAFVDVFPEAVLINPYRQELVLLGSNKAIKLDPAAFERRLAERGAVRADMEKVRMGNLLEIAGMFAGDAETLISATRAVPPLTDNHPLLEYDDLDPRGPRRLPAKLFDTSRVASWCPRCSAEVPELTGYLKVLQDLYASEQYLSTEINAPLSLPTDTPEAVAAVAASPYLVRMIPNRRAAMARGRRLLNESAYGEAIDTIGLAVELDPKDAAARTLLGEAFLLAGVPRGAIWHLERAVALDPNAAAARTLLEQARTSTATAPR